MTFIRYALFPLAVLLALAAVEMRADEVPLTVRITSPLGRTGVHGPIRLVAQVRHAEGVRLQPVKFFVDRRLHGESVEGPPYAVEWVDGNPYEAREITAEVCDEAGLCARDVVNLEPLV